MEDPRSKQFMSTKLHAILSGTMKSPAILPCPTWGPQPLTLSAPDIQPSALSRLDDPGSPEADAPASEVTSGH